MGATSVTGVGMGASGGLQKPDNHSGCLCGRKTDPVEPTVRPKRGCVVSHNTSNRRVYRTGQSSSIRVC